MKRFRMIAESQIRVVPLRDLCRLDLRQVIPGTSDAATLPYVGMEDIESDTGRFLSWPHEADVRSNTFAFDVRHILYGKLRPYLNKVALPDRPGRCSTELLPLLPAPGVDRQYVAWLLRRPETIAAAMQDKTGSRMPRASMTQLMTLTVPLPSLAQQQRIVAKLDEQMSALARAEKALAEQQVAALAFKRATLQMALDPATHPDWPVVPMNSVCILNPTRPNLARPDLQPTSFVPMAAVDEHTGKVTGLAERPFEDVKRGYTYFEDGDVLFAKITPCMQNGKSAIASGLIDRFGFGSTEFHVIRPSARVTAEWIHLWIRQRSVLDEAARHFTGAVGQQRVPVGYVAGLTIPLPSLEEQRQVAEQLDKVRRQLDALSVSLDGQATTLDVLRASLLDAAFSGEI